MNQLTIDGLIRGGLDIAIQNLLPLAVNLGLWIATLWIPYLNMGTTVALLAGIPAKLSRGAPIGWLELFDPAYRANLGDFFLSWALIGAGIVAGSALFVGPGLVLSTAWSLALPLSQERGMNPVKAVVTSFHLTKGYKLPIFFAWLGTWSVGVIVMVGLAWVFDLIHPFLAVLVSLGVLVLTGIVVIGQQAYAYKALTAELNLPSA
jgi:hypothetical protein